MSGTIRDDELETLGRKSLLGAEMAVAAGLTALGAAMNQNHA